MGIGLQYYCIRQLTKRDFYLNIVKSTRKKKVIWFNKIVNYINHLIYFLNCCKLGSIKFVGVIGIVSSYASVY